MRVKCTVCGYSFDVQKRIPKDCPYCGRQNTLRRVKTAEEILREVDELTDQFITRDEK